MKACNETFEFIEAALVENQLDRLRLTIDVFKLRKKIHTYFDQQSQVDSCNSLLAEVVKEEKLLVIYLDKHRRIESIY